MEKIELQNFDLTKRNLYFYGVVDDVKDFVKECNDIIINDNILIKDNANALHTFNKDINIDLTKYIPDINFYLNSPGGKVYDGFAMYDTIRRLNKHCKVNLTVSGQCMSFGIIALLSVPYEQRRATENTTFMIHQVSSFAVGTTKDIEDEVSECKRLTDILYNIIIDNTLITKEDVDKNFNMKKDWILNAKEALNLKLISEII